MMKRKDLKAMKKMICVFSAFVLALALCVGASAEGMLGGWKVCDDPTVTKEAQAVMDKALEGFVGSKVEPVALLATQVVAGTNYCFLCRVTPVVPNAQSAWCLVYVYHALDGSARILEFQDVTLGLSAAE